jgi:SAM-dependent methyltransferase
MTKLSPDWQLWLQESAVQEYLRRGDDGMPSRRDQISVMLSLIPFSRERAINILDLGCGDGILLDAVLHDFPRTKRAIAVDGSPLMLERAARRLGALRCVEYIKGDLSDPQWSTVLPVDIRYDVIVSGFAIHHLPDGRKRDLYRDIYDLLTNNGVFVNVEHVKSRTDRGEQLFEAWYVGHLVELEKARNGSRTPAEIAMDFTERPGKAINHLAFVEDQLKWLREAGFRNVDCHWKYYELAIFAGEKLLVQAEPGRGHEGV